MRLVTDEMPPRLAITVDAASEVAQARGAGGWGGLVGLQGEGSVRGEGYRQ
jgi:hypothetical protein